ncbi:hypothetical protein GF339_06840 [candidate division KSB3 bacterium]|uniref:Uncharacterized protein n=1 Tax=candidate division KSB3 bacterium TaxID=2044937 RepID=A0A9D5Q5F6_9BACT|nr:hypothetical protein [candidate division KSB3 bacterium]MBD3324283.1 hypothetical protein [candidate division KSB3 bacterium]
MSNATPGIAEDDTQRKILELKHQILEIQNQGELGFTNINFCSEIRGLGMYTPLPDNTIPGDEFYVYYEPVNPYTQVQDGTYRIHLTQDLYILDTEGTVLFGKEGLLEFSYETVSPVLDIHMTNTITLTGASPGTYVWKAVLHDHLRGTSAQTTKEFIVE